MNAPEILQCPECGNELPGGLPAGLCPRCALVASSHTTIDSPPSDHHAGLTPLPRDFGDYELLEEIARGGMGIVYRARQKSLDRIVAVKMILAGQHASHDFIKRFRIEASSAAALQHPNIVAIHEVGVHEGEHFLVMDYVGGPNLAQITREQPLPAKTAARYLKTAAEAIHYAHEKGLLHRDLKPSNVIIDSNDQPRVTDFGLAKRVGTASEPATQDLTQLTLSGHVLGSPGYMPPEQAVGARGKIGRRSDVYSLGAMLYHLLTGRPPFGGGSPADTLRQVETQEPVSPRLLNPGVPFDLETICLKCLEKEPARRYQTAQELAGDLGRLLNDEPICSRPVGRVEKVWRWGHRRPAIAALIVLLHVVLAAGLSGILWQWRRAEDHARTAEREQQRAAAAADESQLQRVEDLLAQDHAAIALTHLAQVARRDPSNHVAAARLVSALSQRSFALPITPPLRHDGAVTCAVFSPDGQRVATASVDGTARLWNALSGQPIGEIMRHGPPHPRVPSQKSLPALTAAAAFSADGVWLVTISGDRFAKVWNGRFGQSLFQPLQHEALVRLVEFSPTGERLATVTSDGAVHLWDVRSSRRASVTDRHRAEVFSLRFNGDGTRFVTASADGTIAVWSALTGEREAELRSGSRVENAEFSPDGERIISAGYDGVGRMWSRVGGRQLFSVHPRRNRRAENVMEWAAFSPDGEFFATAGRDRAVRLWLARDGEPSMAPLDHYTWARHVEFSADGQRLLVTCWDNTAWIWNPRDGSPGCAPLRHDGRVNMARFSLDGERVVTASDDGTALVWDVRPGEQMIQYLRHDDTVVRAEFSPDSSRVATASYDGSARIWDVLTGQPRTPPLRHPGWVRWAKFDPSGRSLVTAGRDGTVGVWDTETGAARFPLLHHGARVEFAEFSPDGGRILTVSTAGTLRICDARTGAVLNSISHPGLVWEAHFSPDGRRVVSISRDDHAQVWDAGTAKPAGPPLRHNAALLHVEFSPDGTLVLTSGQDMTARVWDAATGRQRLVLKHFAQVSRARFSPDGRLVLTVSDDTTARLWDASTGWLHNEPLRHNGEVRYGEFSRDGRRVVTVTPNGVARVWDVATCLPVTDPMVHPAYLAHAAFSPDGRWLVTGSEDNAARLCRLPPDGPAPSWLPELAEAVAGSRRVEGQGIQPVPGEELQRLRERPAKAEANDDYTLWGQWFFADRASRVIAAGATCTITQYVDQRLVENTEASLLEALRVQPRNRGALAQLARLSLSQSTNATDSRAALANGYARLAERFSEATEDEGESAGNRDAAPAGATTKAEFWITQGWRLEGIEQVDDAVRAYDKAVALAPTNATALLKRGKLLLRLGRTNDARSDLLAAHRIPERDPATSANCVDLSLHYNAALDDDWHGRQWVGNNLATLPVGARRFGGVDFDVRGIIQLASRLLDPHSPGYPLAVTNIVIARHCQRLEFLHATGWGGFVSNGVHVASYVVHYADGGIEEIPLRNGEDFLEWQGHRAKPELKNALVVWRGVSGRKSPVQLFKKSWRNPRPDAPIATLDFVSTRTDAAPFLVALTAE
jgi:WD40 repeat protein/serine/threonine protein kinase/tetratricopeptide (TPR) repeat protein